MLPLRPGRGCADMTEDPVQHVPTEAGDDALLRLIWLSRAAGSLTSRDLDRIEERSRFHNGCAGITGMLIAQEPHFYGIMEGPGDRLLARMEVIVTDRRHQGVCILREEAVTVHRFASWRLFRLPALPASCMNDPLPIDFIFELSRRLG